MGVKTMSNLMKSLYSITKYLPCLFIVFSLSANGQKLNDANYPSKPIKVIVALSAGGPTDTLARIISQAMSTRLGQPFIIENKPGAGGNIGADFVAKATPDGYTLLMGTSGPLAINSSLYPKLNFDPLKDFSPIGLIASAPFVVTVYPGLPIKTIGELILYAQKNPGKLNYGAVSGNAAHLAAEAFKSAANVDITFIPYKGAAPANNDLMAGLIDLSFASTPGVVQNIENGKLRALAVTSATRIKQLPKVPTLNEAGVSGYEAFVWYGLVAPAQTPNVIIEKINKALASSLQDPSVREQMISNDFSPIGSSPDQFDKFIKAETVKWAKVVKSSGARAD
jgi:tripartite-type tricarboxylate transporter receptor subunit TctC